MFSYYLQVAVKKMKRKFYHWEECISLREVKVIFLSNGYIAICPPTTLFFKILYLIENHPCAGPPETKSP
jgi:hypothetical protein